MRCFYSAPGRLLRFGAVYQGAGSCALAPHTPLRQKAQSRAAIAPRTTSAASVDRIRHTSMADTDARRSRSQANSSGADSMHMEAERNSCRQVVGSRPPEAVHSTQAERTRRVVAVHSWRRSPTHRQKHLGCQMPRQAQRRVEVLRADRKSVV